MAMVPFEHVKWAVDWRPVGVVAQSMVTAYHERIAWLLAPEPAAKFMAPEPILPAYLSAVGCADGRDKKSTSFSKKDSADTTEVNVVRQSGVMVMTTPQFRAWQIVAATLNHPSCPQPLMTA